MRWIALIPALFAGAIHAADIDLGGLTGASNPNVAQEDFKNISQDMAGALSFKHLQPSEPLGITGFDISGEATYMKTAHPESWRRLTGSDVDELGTVGIKVTKGLPFGLDVGAAIRNIPGSNGRVLGGMLSYSLEEGGIISPALAIRASATRLDDVDDIDFSTASLDLSISKGFAFITPYIGGGVVYSKSSVAKSDAAIALEDEKNTEAKVYGGVRISLLLFQILAEADKIGDNESFSLRLGFGF